MRLERCAPWLIDLQREAIFFSNHRVTSRCSRGRTFPIRLSLTSLEVIARIRLDTKPALVAGL